MPRLRVPGYAASTRRWSASVPGLATGAQVRCGSYPEYPSTARPKERLARGAADASTAEEVIAVAAVSSVTSRRKVLVFCHGVPVWAAASRGPSLFTSDRSAADPAN